MTAPRPLLFGEVLFDHFPDGSAVLGGAPFNVAWNLQALGARPLLITRVGQDETGERVLAAMRTWGLDTAGVQRDAAHPTGRVQVSLVDREPSYEIARDQAYDHLTAQGMPPLEGPHLLYHGSLALRGPTSRAALAALAARSAATRLVDVNLRAPFWERSDVLELCRGAEVIKLNEDELEALASPGGSSAERATRLLQHTGAQQVLLTRGAAGAMLVGEAGVLAEAQPSGQTEVVDCVGAGDALTAVVMIGRIAGWDSGTTLHRAVAFSEAVVGLRGATSSDPVFYSPFTHRWLPS